MKKKIWLINPGAMPPKFEMRIQTLKRAQYLMEFGYDVTIIGGSYLHNTEIELIRDNKKYLKANHNGIKFIHIKTCKYKNNGIIRMYNLLEFHFRLFFLANKFNKPDIIAQMAAVPFGNIIYYLAKKYKAKYIVDVVDLWPESFVAFGMVSKNNPFLKLAYLAEYWLYKKADKLVFSMEGGKKYITEKGWDIENGGYIDLNKVHYINNGVDLADFDKNRDLYKLEDADLENDKTFKVIYIGSIRLANNLIQLIEAAEILKDTKDITFLIYGDGGERVFLENYCKHNNLENVKFKQKWIELKYIPYILSKSSLNILNYIKSPITRFGGSQSKSFQYMASGKPICANLKMAFCPITKYNLGIAEEFQSSEKYADAILSFVKMDSIEYNKMCENSRNAAKNYDYKKLTAEFEKLLKYRD
jgi:glycosyltransferase involved in cell wall biosynthesis